MKSLYILIFIQFSIFKSEVYNTYLKQGQLLTSEDVIQSTNEIWLLKLNNKGNLCLHQSNVGNNMLIYCFGSSYDSNNFNNKVISFSNHGLIGYQFTDKFDTNLFTKYNIYYESQFFLSNESFLVVRDDRNVVLIDGNLIVQSFGENYRIPCSSDSYNNDSIIGYCTCFDKSKIHNSFINKCETIFDKKLYYDLTKNSTTDNEYEKVKSALGILIFVSVLIFIFILGSYFFIRWDRLDHDDIVYLHSNIKALRRLQLITSYSTKTDNGYNYNIKSYFQSEKPIKEYISRLSNDLRRLFQFKFQFKFKHKKNNKEQLRINLSRYVSQKLALNDISIKDIPSDSSIDNFNSNEINDFDIESNKSISNFKLESNSNSYFSLISDKPDYTINANSIFMDNNSSFNFENEYITNKISNNSFTDKYLEYDEKNLVQDIRNSEITDINMSVITKKKSIRFNFDDLNISYSNTKEFELLDHDKYKSNSSKAFRRNSLKAVRDGETSIISTNTFVNDNISVTSKVSDNSSKDGSNRLSRKSEKIYEENISVGFILSNNNTKLTEIVDKKIYVITDDSDSAKTTAQFSAVYNLLREKSLSERDYIQILSYDFLESVFPTLALQDLNLSWKYLIYLYQEHCFIAMFQKPSLRNTRFLRWFKLFRLLIINLYVNTTFFAVYFPDNGFCEKFNKSNCSMNNNITTNKSTCKWVYSNESNNGYCKLSLPFIEFKYLLLIALLVKLVSIPIELIISILVTSVCSKTPHLSKLGMNNDIYLGSSTSQQDYDNGITKSTINELLNKVDELNASFNFKNKSVKLSVKHSYNDYLTANEEIEIVTRKISDYFKAYSNLNYYNSLESAKLRIKIKSLLILCNMTVSIFPLMKSQHLLNDFYKKFLVKKLKLAKRNQYKINKKLKEFPAHYVEQRDIYLIQSFILENFSWFQRYCLLTEFFSVDNITPETVNPVLWFISWILVILTFTYFLYVIFEWTLLNNGYTVRFWGLIYLIVLTKELLFIQFGKIYLIKIIGLESAKCQLRDIYNVLNNICLRGTETIDNSTDKSFNSLNYFKSDSPTYSLRLPTTFSFYSNNSDTNSFEDDDERGNLEVFNLIQYISGACRVARTFNTEKSPAAFILQQLTDEDKINCLGKKYTNNHSFQPILQFPPVSMLFYDSILNITIPSLLTGFLIINNYLFTINKLIIIIPYAVLLVYIMVTYKMINPFYHIVSHLIQRKVISKNWLELINSSKSRYNRRHSTKFIFAKLDNNHWQVMNYPRLLQGYVSKYSLDNRCNEMNSFLHRIPVEISQMVPNVLTKQSNFGKIKSELTKPNYDVCTSIIYESKVRKNISLLKSTDNLSVCIKYMLLQRYYDNFNTRDVVDNDVYDLINRDERYYISLTYLNDIMQIYITYDTVIDLFNKFMDLFIDYSTKKIKNGIKILIHNKFINLITSYNSINFTIYIFYISIKKILRDNFKLFESYKFTSNLRYIYSINEIFLKVIVSVKNLYDDIIPISDKIHKYYLKCISNYSSIYDLNIIQYNPFYPNILNQMCTYKQCIKHISELVTIYKPLKFFDKLDIILAFKELVNTSIIIEGQGILYHKFLIWLAIICNYYRESRIDMTIAYDYLDDINEWMIPLNIE